MLSFEPPPLQMTGSGTSLAGGGLKGGPKACTYCGNTRTPLWRNGLPGPKSLCNACGIRFNKMKAGKIRATSLLTFTGRGNSNCAPATPMDSEKRSTMNTAANDNCLASFLRARECDSGVSPRPCKRRSVWKGEESSSSGEGDSSDGSCVTKEKLTRRRSGSVSMPEERHCGPSVQTSVAATTMNASCAWDDRAEGANLLLALFYGSKFDGGRAVLA